MVSASTGKMMLIVAFVLGIVQGLMMLIGGLVAAHDKDNNIKEGEANYHALIGLYNNPYSKYGCGLVRLITTEDYTVVSNKDADCSYEKMDRGWFKRFRDILKTGGGCDDIVDLNRDYCRRNIWKILMACAITCGIGWLVSACVALVASLINNKLVGFISGGAFIIFYIIFIALFGTVWHSVRKLNEDCFNNICKDMRKQVKRSSGEFLAYSICSFILILGAIICCFIGALGLGGSDSSSGYDNEPKASLKPNKEEEKVLSTPIKPDKNDNELNEPLKQPAGVSLAGKEYIEKFKQLNRYIADKNKMQKYADKKFDQTDTDKSGTLVLSEFKKFVTDIMTKKKLPPPSDRKVAAMMKKYDTDKSNTLEKKEFEQMLLEIFLESREILISKYAEKKAESWKPERIPSKKDTSELGKLDALLKDSDQFYAVLSEIGKLADKNQDRMMSIEETADMIKMFCNRYKVPTIIKNDIVEVMFDMGREVKEYDIYDLRMVAFAVLSISRNLLK